MRRFLGTSRLHAALLLFVAFLLVSGEIAKAQTAHFNYAQSVIDASIKGYAIAVDNSRNLYVTDVTNKQVLKYVWTGNSYDTPTVVASGLDNPQGVAVDSSGNLYVSDKGLGEVLEYAWTGSSYGTQTVAVSGLNEPLGVGVDSSGNLYVAEYGANRTVKVPFESGTYGTPTRVGPADSNYGGTPVGLAVDGDRNVYIANASNGYSFKYVWTGSDYNDATVVEHSTYLPIPRGIAVDGDGHVYVTNSRNDTVVKATWTGSEYDGPTTVTSDVNSPNGVAVYGHGGLYITDASNSRLLRLQTVAVDFFTEPVGSTSAAQTLTFTIDTAGTIGAPLVLTQGAIGKDFVDVGTGTCTTNGTSYSYAAGDTCTVVVSFTPSRPGQRLGAVQLLSSSGAGIATANVYGTGTGPKVIYSPPTQSILGNFSEPSGVAVDGNGNVFVADSGNNAVKEIVAVNGVVSSSSTVNTVGSGFKYPTDVAVDGNGNVFVADYSNGVVKEILAVNGVVSSSSTVVSISNGLGKPFAVAVDSSGDVFVADPAYDTTVEIIQGTGGAASGTVNSDSRMINIGSGFNVPHGIAVDSSGNVFVADSGYSVVYKIVAGTGDVPSGFVNTSSTTTKISSAFRDPSNVAVDNNGNVFVADLYNNAVKEIVAVNGTVSSSSTVTTIGSGFSEPSGVAVDSNGNIFVADSANSAVKEVNFADAPILTFATVTNAGTTDTTDGAQSVTITNSGDAALTAITPGLSLLSNFIQTSGSGTPEDCTTSFSLAQGESCNLSIEFKPEALTDGAVTSSAVLTDNNLNISPSTTQTIVLKGTALGPPTVTAVSPRNGTTAGGTSVTITGKYFTGATAVSFGGIQATNVTVVSDTTITATSPAGNAGVVDITVTIPRGTSPTSTADQYTYIEPVVAQPVSQTVADGSTNNSITLNISGGTATSVAVASAPLHGTAIASGTSITYTPTPGYVGSDSFAYTATNALGTSAAAKVAITISIPTIKLTPTTLPSGSYGSTYTPVTISASGGVSPYIYTVSAGSLPTGLTLSSTGVLSGTANAAGSFTFTVTAADSSASPYAGTQAYTLVVTQAATSTSLSVSSSQIVAGASVTLNAQVVSATTGTPTGTASFYDGTTLLSTVPLTKGAASYTATGLAAGLAHNLTTAYSGDTNFTTSTSPSASVTVTVPNLDFTFTSTGTASQSVVPGKAATYTFAIAPLYQSYGSAVNFTVSGLPAGATAVFSPSSIAADGGAQTVTMAVTTASATAKLLPEGRRILPFSLALLLFPPLLGLGRGRKKLARMLFVAALLIGGAGATVLLNGCGTSNGFLGQPAKDYTVTVTATAGAIQHSATVTLNVQ